MLQKLPIAFAQVKAGNNSGSLFNEIRKAFYSLYHSKQITKKYTITSLSQYNEITLKYKGGYYVYEFRRVKHLSCMF